MKKSVHSKATVTETVPAPAARITDPLPTQDPPKPPSGWQPVKVGRGYRPLKSQVYLATKAATELRASATYAATFGSSAPGAEDVADSLSTAAAWTQKLQLAEAWYAYVKGEEHLAWRDALGKTDTLQVPFEFQEGRDPSVAKSFPSLTAFFAAPKARAAKATSTKKRKKQASASAGASSSATPTVGSTPAKLLN